jgi:hypothetical protein
MATSDLRSWAVKGAEQRLGEIAEEAKVIFQTFPELRHRGRGFDLPKASARAGGSVESPAKATSRSHRRKMSPAARKAVSDRMKKFWAARRGEGHNRTPSGQAAQANDETRSRQGGPRKMSAEARKRISDAQKARWAKQRARNATSATKSTSRRKK